MKLKLWSRLVLFRHRMLSKRTGAESGAYAVIRQRVLLLASTHDWPALPGLVEEGRGPWENWCADSSGRVLATAALQLRGRSSPLEQHPVTNQQTDQSTQAN